MPIVNLFSDLYRDQLAGGAIPDPALANARLYTKTGTVTNGATDLNTSSYKICDLPSNCILDDRTKFDVENDGYAAIRIGTKTDVDALVSQTKATENIITPIVFGDANHGTPLWETLGLAEDPGGFIGIYKHGIADATGAGSMPFRISYLA